MSRNNTKDMRFLAFSIKSGIFTGFTVTFLYNAVMYAAKIIFSWPFLYQNPSDADPYKNLSFQFLMGRHRVPNANVSVC